jgi:type IV pilus assembly protein PilM
MLSWGFKTRGLRPIGLDVGHNSVKMIQLLMDGEHISVIAADEIRIEPGINEDEQSRRSFVISSIKEMLSKGNFKGKNVVSCLPSGKLKITSLRLPETEEQEIEQILRKEVTHRFGLNPDEDTMDYVFAGNVKQDDEIKSELIVFAAEKETIKGHIQILVEAGLKPVAIDIIPFALFRSFERSLRRQEDRDRTTVFVDVGSCFTTVVFGRGGEISFVKEIPIGGEKFNQEVAAKLGVNVGEAEVLRDAIRTEKGFVKSKSNLPVQGPNIDGQNIDAQTRQVVVDAVSGIVEDLAREISLCLRYYTVTFRGKRVERAIIAGGGAYEDILLNVLRRYLSVNLEIAQPLRGFNLSSERTNLNFDGDRRGFLCEWAVAVGLSLKGWKGASEEEIIAGCNERENYERD